MTDIKDILLSIQERLAGTVPELAYIDKDWGQLNYEQPSVKWPCALLDIENINYTQQGNGYQLADTQVTVTVANMRLTASSLNAPKKAEAYKIIELLAKIHSTLHLFTALGYSPLFRTNLRRVVADSTKECYKMTYQTAFSVPFGKTKTAVPSSGVKIIFDTGASGKDGSH